MLSQGRLKELYDYSPDTGVFVRKTSISQCKAGDVAGSIDQQTGYIRLSADGKQYWAHRLVFLYMTGEMPKKYVDHINRCKTDNRWANLRDVTQSENLLNGGKHKRNTSGVRGVSWNKHLSRWMISARVDGKNRYLGSSKALEEATAMRRAWEAKNLPAHV
jgi:hypothetical protein